MKLRITFFLILMVYSCLPGMIVSYAQVTNIGPVENWSGTESGLQGKTSAAWFQVRVYNEHVIRVRVSLSEEMDDFSYVLDKDLIPEKVKFDIIENGNSVVLNTAVIEMEIEKTPAFRVIFRNKEGKILNEDVAGQGFGTSFIGLRSTIYKKLFPDERFVGLGEVLGNLDHRGSAYALNNTDTYKYGDPRMPMYVSIPFYIGIHDSLAYGLFYHNTYKTFFNFGASTPTFSSITAEGGDVDYFFIYDENIEKILYHYTWLTGRMNLPPLWSLGYHQSRCSYFPQNNVKILAETFRAKQIPIDCIVLDADYLHEYEPFRINKERFPDMPGLTTHLAELGIEVTASVNPGIKVDSTYFAHLDGLKKDVFIKYSDGSIYTADIAPSTNNFVDFTNPKARQWWAGNMKFLPENGIHGYWNDMNEPAVGASYLPDNLLFDYDGRKANALEAKNLYGMLMARSSYEAAIENGGNRRPFILTRSGFAGVQRYATVWTGDNTAKDEYLLGGALLNTQLGLSGLPFVGDDIGGYIGNTTKELFIRWIEVGVFEPFARNHKEAFSLSNEPWSYGEEAEGIAKEYIGFRYRLMPYLYAKFYEARQTGMPVARSLCISDPFDAKIYDNLYQYQFLCGDAIMVVPVTTAEKSKKFYLPHGRWYDLYSDEYYEGNREYSKECRIHEIPLFVKGSSVIPMQSLVQSTKEMPSDTLFIHVYNGDDKNEFVYYEDDGSTLDYKNGLFFKRKITFDPETKEIVFSKAEVHMVSLFKHLKVVFHGFEKMEEVRVNGNEVEVQEQVVKLLDGLKYLEAIYDPGYFTSLRGEEKINNQQVIVITNLLNEIKIDWK
jgi:alpha-glucosidase